MMDGRGRRTGLGGVPSLLLDGVGFGDNSMFTVGTTGGSLDAVLLKRTLPFSFLPGTTGFSSILSFG
jgi:hypothetical protein